MRNALVVVLCVPMMAMDLARGDDPAEELPPPKEERSVLTNDSPSFASPLEKAWGLVGIHGRHYFIGGTALADYQQDGLRHLAVLEAEDSAARSNSSDIFDYFREKATGNRWAIARQASGDGRYRVYFQAADRRGEWQLFQRGTATWDQERDQSAPVLLWNESTGGESSVEESIWFQPDAQIAGGLDAEITRANNWIKLSSFRERIRQWLSEPWRWMKEP